MLKMASTFTTCLFCSCFFLDRWNLVSMKGGNYPKPSLRITSGSVTVRGGNLTMRCTAPAQYTDMRFALYGGGYSVPPQDPPGTEAAFHFTNVNDGHEGRYNCLYYSKGAPRTTSDHSDAVEVTLQDSYPKPSVTLNPERGVARGRTLTIKCTSEYQNMRFVLYRGETPGRQEEPPGNEAAFVISGVQRTDEGSYECRYYPRSGTQVWSDASDPFRIQVLDLPNPSISYEMVQSLEGDCKIICSAPQGKTVKRFFLYKDGAQIRLIDRTPAPESRSVTFPISGVNAKVGTKYRCSYQIQESGEIVESPLSDPIQIEKGNKQETSRPTTPGNDEQTLSGEPTPSSMMTTTYIAIGCAVLLVVILVVALILYIKCKPKKAKGDIQKRNLPLNEQKNAEALETTYATVTKVKASNHTIAPEVKRQKEDRDDEGLTYATINKDALKTKKKNSSSPFQEPETTLYAAVNIH